MVKKTWADVVIEVFPAILSTLGPIGIGVCVIVSTMGIGFWIADRRGWTKPEKEPEVFKCKASNSECLTLLTAIHGASEAGHRTTHDQLNRLLNQTPEGCPLDKK